VLLIIDSITRFAHAARDVAMAAGELAVARGYAPSVFSDLPKLLERAGPGEEGQARSPAFFRFSSMETISTILSPMPFAHARRTYRPRPRHRRPGTIPGRQRSNLDLAVAQKAWTHEQSSLVARLRALIARYEDTRDLRLMGATGKGPTRNSTRP